MKSKSTFFKIKLIVVTLLASLVIFSCGTELQLYEWETMDLRLLNTQTRDTLTVNAEIEASNFSILVSLNPENSIKVRSSDWVNYSQGFQANDNIESLEITSNQDYNDIFPEGELLNDVFDAAFINEPETRLPLDLFLESFGKETNRIEEGFELLPNIVGEGAPRDSLRRFIIRLELEKNGTFLKTTENVRIF